MPVPVCPVPGPRTASPGPGEPPPAYAVTSPRSPPHSVWNAPSRSSLR